MLGFQTQLAVSLKDQVKVIFAGNKICALLPCILLAIISNYRLLGKVLSPHVLAVSTIAMANAQLQVPAEHRKLSCRD